MTRHVWTTLDMVEILWLHLFLVCLPVIEVVEVGNNDRHRERDRQHAGNGTQGPYYFSPHTYWPVCFQKYIISIHHIEKNSVKTMLTKVFWALFPKREWLPWGNLGLETGRKKVEGSNPLFLPLPLDRWGLDPKGSFLNFRPRYLEAF